MNKLSLIVLFILFCLSSYSQTDPKSRSILGRTSEVNSAYKTIESNFNFSTTDLLNNKTSTEKGSFALKGEKYKLKIDKTDILFDGKSIYHYNPESNEINITYPEPARTEKGDFFLLKQNNPLQLL